MVMENGKNQNNIIPTNIRVNLKMIKKMDMAYLNGTQVEFIRDNFKMI